MTDAPATNRRPADELADLRSRIAVADSDGGTVLHLVDGSTVKSNMIVDGRLVEVNVSDDDDVPF
jgi:hypothetical protein